MSSETDAFACYYSFVSHTAEQYPVSPLYVTFAQSLVIDSTFTCAPVGITASTLPVTAATRSFNPEGAVT